MSNPLVSVVIPTYNRANIIKNTIDSVLNQTYKNIEIIVVDDGSTDNTQAIVDSYIADIMLGGGGIEISNMQIKYFYQENAGPSAARNKGLQESAGEFISFLDCADEWFPLFVEKCLNTFKQDKEAGCVYCFTGVNNNEQIVAARIDTLSGYIYKEALEQGYVTSPLSIMMKRCCFDKSGNWDENLQSSEDDDICFKLAKHFKIVLIPEILVYVNTKEGMGISSDSKRTANGWWDLWQKYKDEVIENCGVEVLMKHYLYCFDLFKKLDDDKMQRVILKEIVRLKFKVKYIFMYLSTYSAALYKKERLGDKRIITLFNFIKIKYKKMGNKAMNNNINIEKLLNMCQHKDFGCNKEILTKIKQVHQKIKNWFFKID